ncbi:UDP-N-acetylmuramoyl-tripeptide--D-alanyl-D-alanine ligase [Streptomyces sp. NPDC058206]|uniref:UDP-N-acetylmuramoyl-tripeptide--D-alanyl-D- alanine ligase n=1 Tax=Streptomyces sp. NPDC058206 TaxID=3346382 RepID=UPI0036E84B50
MIPLTLAQLTAAAHGTLHKANGSVLVTGPISFDSREIHPGGLFACLTGRTMDGHEFAEQAVAAGAVAVLASRPVDAPAIVVPDVLAALADIAHIIAEHYTGTVVALTGSAGKTTTKDILETVLSLDGPTVANHRSFNNEIGFPVTVSRVEPDTRYLVLEMGARGRGHIEALCNTVQPTTATVLGIGSAHVGEFGSREAIADAKAEIVRALPAHGLAVLYGDDPLVRAMAKDTPARVVTFGTGLGCDVRADEIGTDGRGRPRFTLRHMHHAADVQLRIHGRHNVTNALAAAATALAIGVPFHRAVEGLLHAELSSGGRMEVTERNGVTIINDAFNASPESVLAALDALKDIAGADDRKVVFLGEMAELGDEAEQWHQRVAEKLVTISPDLLFGLGDNHIHRIIQTARDHGIDATHVHTGSLQDVLLNVELSAQDVVLVKGANALGMEAAARALSERTRIPEDA